MYADSEGIKPSKSIAQTPNKRRLADNVKPTFFISTTLANKEQASRIAGFLKSSGLRWVLNRDWTASQINNELSDREFTAAGFVSAASSADLYVFLATNTPSLGASCELGARLGVNKEAHVITQGNEEHLFYKHPCVMLHDSVETFLDYIFR